MYGFDSQVLVRVIDGVRFRVEAPLAYTSKSGAVFTIPALFVTDFASSYIFRWNLLSRQASNSDAAVLHDWLYYTGIVTRAEADKLFLEALEACGIGIIVRTKAYWGVRMFGWTAWNYHRKHNG